MAFKLYDLILCGILVLNSYAIINERFVIQIEKLLFKLGKRPETYKDPNNFSVIGQALAILDSDSKRLFQMPLIWLNIIIIIIELLP